jgi:hypothetical protein
VHSTETVDITKIGTLECLEPHSIPPFLMMSCPVSPKLVACLGSDQLHSSPANNSDASDVDARQQKPAIKGRPVRANSCNTALHVQAPMQAQLGSSSGLGEDVEDEVHGEEDDHDEEDDEKDDDDRPCGQRMPEEEQKSGIIDFTVCAAP